MRISTLRARPLLAAVLCGGTLLLGASGAAQAAFWNPPIRTTAQGIEYMCGGLNHTEAQFMEMVAPRWAATLEFTVSRAARGEFPDQARVVVRDRYNGQVAMEAKTDGPYMLARLNPGAYEVDVTLGGLTLTRSLTVIAGVPARASFVWPSNFDMASVQPPQTFAQGK